MDEMLDIVEVKLNTYDERKEHVLLQITIKISKYL